MLRDGAVVFDRPIFGGSAGKGVDDGEVFDGLVGDNDARFGDALDRERGEKREGEMADGIAKFGAVGAIPGVDGIELREIGEAATGSGVGVVDAKEIEAGVGDGLGSFGKLNEWQNRARGPDFGVVGTMRFEFGQGEDAVADGAGADEESAHSRRIPKCLNRDSGAG